MSVDTLTVPYQPHLRSPSPPAVIRKTPQLQVLTAIDCRSRRQRPDRQVATTAVPRPLPQETLYNIRHMSSDDLPAVARLMKSEGWNVNFDNMAVVFHAQPFSFFLVETTDGEVVGHSSSLCLNDSVGMESYVLVSSKHQKRGLGSRLMDIARQSLGGRTMAFYSVEDKVPFQKRLGFDTRRFSALVRDFSLDPEDFNDLSDDERITVVKTQEVDFTKMNKYDSAVQGMDRAEYLRQWILRDSHVSFAALDSVTGEVVGYVSLSFSNGRWDVTPLYADSDDIAMQLLKRASLEIAETIRVFVRIPADSSSAIKLFSKARDIQHHRVLYLMSDKPIPNLSSDKVYSLSTVCYGLK